MIKATLAAIALATASMAAPAAAQTAAGTYRTLDEGRFAIIVKLTIVPEQRENFLRAMKARIAYSRNCPEVVDFRILATTDPLVFQGYESFVSKAAFEDFAKSPESQAFLAEVKPLLARNVEATVLSPLP